MMTGKEDIHLEIKYTFLNDVMVSVVYKKYELMYELYVRFICVAR